MPSGATASLGRSFPFQSMVLKTRSIEVYAFVGEAYALIQWAGSGDDVKSRVLPDLVLRAGEVFP